MKKRYHIVWPLAILFSVSWADPTGWTYAPGRHDPNSGFHDRMPATFHDDILVGQVEQIKLTKADLQQAANWGLSNDEEKRYITIMQNRGAHYFKTQVLQTQDGSIIVSASYTPVEILGINARTDSEREKYAAIQAKQEFQFLAKFLAYNAAYAKAAVALKTKLQLPVLRSFDTAKFSPLNYKPVVLQPHDVLYLYVHPHDEVRPIMSFLISAIQQDSTIKLHVYFVTQHAKTVTDTMMLSWAHTQNLPTKLVGPGRQVTLDIDDHNRFQSIKSKTTQATPVLILMRDGTSRFVETEGF